MRKTCSMVWCAVASAKVSAVDAAAQGARLLTVENSAIKRVEAPIKGATKHDAEFSRVPTTFAFVRPLVVDDVGRVWARRVTADSSVTTFEVFDREGRFAFSAHVSERLSPFGRLLVRQDVLYGVALDDDDVPTIVKARLAPPQ